MTAVEFLVKELLKRSDVKYINNFNTLVEQANQMFEEQIMDAFQEGKWDWNDHLQNFAITKDPKEYYNETYKK